MRNPILHRLFAVGVVTLLLASGCDLGPSQLDEDQAAIESLILDEADFFTADFFGESGAEDPTTPKALADITPRLFGRQITSVSRDVTIQITDPSEGPSTAEVTWNAALEGVFHVVATDDAQYTKDFMANAVRYATFVRRDGISANRRGWRLTSVSGTEVLSDPATVSIVSVNLTSTSGVDTTFSDVSTLADREDLLRFAIGDTVSVTVTTGNTDDVVLLHYPAWRSMDSSRHHVRRQMTNNGDGTYSGEWVVRGSVHGLHQMGGPRHVTIDVLSNGSVYTDDEPYDSVAWGFIYITQAP